MAAVLTGAIFTLLFFGFSFISEAHSGDVLSAYTTSDPVSIMGHGGGDPDWVDADKRNFVFNIHDDYTVNGVQWLIKNWIMENS